MAQPGDPLLPANGAGCRGYKSDAARYGTLATKYRKRAAELGFVGE
jgi:hypothetical protein